MSTPEFGPTLWLACSALPLLKAHAFAVQAAVDTPKPVPCPAPQPHHRIFVVDPAKAHTMTVHDQTVVINIKPGTEKPEASGLRPTDVVSQFDVVKLLTEHRDKLELVEAKTLEELEVFEVSRPLPSSLLTERCPRERCPAGRWLLSAHRCCIWTCLVQLI